MPQYKIVTSDLDGTLFPGTATVSKENYAAIREMAELGVHFVPSSGRTLSQIPQELRDCPHIRYLIYSNGSVIHDKETGRELFLCMDAETVGEVLDLLSRYRAYVYVHVDGTRYMSATQHSEAFYESFGISRGWRDFFYRYGNGVEDFDAFARSQERTETVCAFFADLEERAACMEALKSNPLVQFAFTSYNNIEINAAASGKGSALLALAESLGIDKEATIAVGDGDNDRDMLQKAGLGLAVSNAKEVLKSVADAVICSNKEHIAPYILEHYIK